MGDLELESKLQSMDAVDERSSEEIKASEKSPQEIYGELGPTALFLRTTTARKAAVVAASKAAKEQEEENARRAAEARRRHMEKQLRQGSLCGLFELKPTLPRMQNGESEWEPFLQRRSVLGLEFVDLLVRKNAQTQARRSSDPFRSKASVVEDEAPEVYPTPSWLADMNADYIRSAKRRLSFDDLKSHDSSFDADILALFGHRPKVRDIRRRIQDFIENNDSVLKEKRAALSRSFASDRAVLMRESFRESPQFNALVTLFWLAADIDENNTLSREGYLLLCRKLQIAILGYHDAGYGYELAERDWALDAQGKDTLTFAKLSASFFLLADMFVNKLDEHAYCGFVHALAQRVLRVDAATHSILEFRTDANIISRKAFAFLQHEFPSWEALDALDTPRATRKFFGRNTFQVEDICGPQPRDAARKGHLAATIQGGLERKRAVRGNESFA
ncbi:Hypothetical Protein FCC1311_029752 [Hondaea fermentalgiana]|uniref:Uncharacterized protein n=1 Tax=Hondaea fermentalgiana TaxID=2315210 RepID=A0A2R5GFX5_9STRA|nr:Hypothetical Protein FCC1311_029752 [Hondaea fermentalgiana]|eukprot:GBG26754.1 Hypothetical Protein FCC1311_029752 [Hondaea fermentalgiana]